MEKNYSDFNGDYFVFDGENASTGTPNVITGEMSFYGNTYKFKCKKDAVDYVNEYRGYEICKAGTARTLRKYNLGSSVINYLEDLALRDYE